MTEAQIEAKAKAKIWLFGLPFRPMVETDHEMYEGRTETDLIGFPADDTVLIYSPDSREVAEIWDGGTRLWQLAMTMTD